MIPYYSKNAPSKLPANCEIHVIGAQAQGTTFRISFKYPGRPKHDYMSGSYYTAPGVDLESCARDICTRYRWFDKPPKSVATPKAELQLLREALERMDDDMEGNPEAYLEDAETIWSYTFDWTKDEFVQEMNGDGTDNVPSLNDEEWYSYGQDTESVRLIPHSVADIDVPEGQPRGIEIIDFFSGGPDDSFDCYASFSRHQPGAVISGKDTTRHKRNVVRSTKAWNAYKKAEEKQGLTKPEVKVLRDEHFAASDQKRITEYVSQVGTESWDPQEFLRCSLYNDYRWQQIHTHLYEIWCVEHGKDPLHHVSAEYGYKSAEFDITATHTGHKVKRVQGDADLLTMAKTYVSRQTLKDWHKSIELTPAGVKDSARSLNYSWYPLTNTPDEVVIRLSVSGHARSEITARRIRQVNDKELRESVLRLLHEIETNKNELARVRLARSTSK